MKKFLAIIIAVLTAFSLFGCKKDEPELEGELPVIEIPQEKQDNGSAFYEKMQSNTRPIAVMIDNDDHRARPQMGLESAYLVYEIVVEGSATRFMALFKEPELEKVGPIRSSRHYFLDYAMENDARYVHAGFSDKAAADIKSLGINNINGLNETIFWRDKTYDSTWHNMYTSLKKVSELSDKKGYRNTTDKSLLTYSKEFVTPNGEDATHLTIPYANFYKVEFKYNGETKLYERYVNNSPHKSQTGDGLTAKNIIVYTLTNVPLNDGINATRQDLRNIGSGEGYYLSEGKSVKIKWEKTSRGAQTVYTDENGEKLTLNPGNTYIQIVPSYSSYTIEP